MKHFPRRAAMTVAVLALLAAGCQPGDNSDTPASAPAAAEEGAQAAGGDADALQIPGLETQRERVSYMIGMDIGKGLEPISEEVDLETLNKALATVFAGEEPLMTQAQAATVRQNFGRKLQAQQIAERKATAARNKAEGEALLAANADKPGVEVTQSGLQYKVLAAAEGEKPQADDIVRVHYKGTLPDGEVFDSSYERDEPVVFSLDQVVPGWQEGIALMPVGSKYKFWIPSALGYGPEGTPGGPIGPNQVLVFEVELLEIVEPPVQPSPPAE